MCFRTFSWFTTRMMSTTKTRCWLGVARHWGSMASWGSTKYHVSEPCYTDYHYCYRNSTSMRRWASERASKRRSLYHFHYMFSVKTQLVGGFWAFDPWIRSQSNFSWVYRRSHESRSTHYNLHFIYILVIFLIDILLLNCLFSSEMLRTIFYSKSK